MRSVTPRLVLAAVWALATVLAAPPAPADPDVPVSSDCRPPVSAPAGAADLRPGVDVRGRSVEPADLNPPSPWARRPAIDLRVEVGGGPIAARRPARLEGILPLGRLTIEEGEARLDGQPLTDDDAPSSARCRGASTDARVNR